MADTGGIKAGKAYVEAYLDKTKLTRGLKSVSADLQAFGAGVASMGTKFMALGAGIVTPLLGAAATFAKDGSDLNDMSARTGMSTNALSELGFAADMTGASIGAIETSTKKMQKAITAATQGGKEQVEAFTQLGLSVSDLESMAPEDQFEAIGNAIGSISDPTKKTAMAMAIFGKSGTALLPMLNDMGALRAEAVRLGLSMGPEQAAAADALGDAWDKAKGSLKAASLAIGSALAPMLTGLAERIATGVVAIREFISAHKPLIIQILSAGVAAIAAGAALFVLGKTIVLVGGMFSATLAIIKGAVATFGFLQSAVLLLANPFVLVGLAAVALGGYLLYASGAAGKAATWISQTFATLLSEVTSTFDTIAESMAAGDFVSAAKVGWAMVILQWQKGVSFIVSLWEWFKGTYDLATSGLAIGIINASAAIQSIWADLCNWMYKTWISMMSSLIQNDMVAKIVSAMYKAAGSSASPESIKALGRITAQQAPAKADTETAKRKEQIERDRQGQVDVIGGDLNRRKKDRDAKTQAARDRVDAAKADWETAKSEAKDKAEAAKGNTFDFAGKVAGLDIESAKGTKSSASGTFSASAVGGMGTGGVQEKIEKNTKAAVKLQERAANSFEAFARTLKQLSLEAEA